MADNKMIACNLTLGEIESLAETLKKNDIERIKIKNGDCEVVIEAKRKCSPMPIIQPMGASVQPMVNNVNTSSAAEAAPDVKKDAPAGNVVKSPIVGTFYASPSPDKAPFVKVGDNVNKGDVIMIIESMKLMNEVQSEYSGTVKEFLVENGDAVEFDQPIMIIE